MFDNSLLIVGFFILQSKTGLLYLKNPRQRPLFSDRIIILVSSWKDPNEYLAGAQIPISRIPSFPFRFRISDKNVFGKTKQNQELWADICQREDLLVSAVVCSPQQGDKKSFDDSSKWSKLCLLQNRQTVTSDIDEEQKSYPTVHAIGASKLLRLDKSDQAIPEGSPTVVMRIPASLGLE
jgi:hypothetical protein